MQTLIIGIGNPLRGDDGLGWNLAQELLHEVQGEGVRIVATHQLTPEMAELVSRAERVLFIDAARSGEPGTLECKRVAAVTANHRLSHDLSVGEIVAVSEKLYGRAPVAYLLTVAGESFATGDRISDRVSAAIPSLRSQIRHFIEHGRLGDVG